MGIFLDINRRHLLMATTILAGVAPIIQRASFIPRSGITNANSLVSSYPEIKPQNFSNITNLRLREIAERNSIRQEAGLPLLSVPKELRRMKEAANAEKFRAFADANRKRVYAKLLGQVRRRFGEPNWTPSGVLSGGGVWFSAQVDQQLRKLYRRKTEFVSQERVTCR